MNHLPELQTSTKKSKQKQKKKKTNKNKHEKNSTSRELFDSSSNGTAVSQTWDNDPQGHPKSINNTKYTITNADLLKIITNNAKIRMLGDNLSNMKSNNKKRSNAANRIIQNANQRPINGQNNSTLTECEYEAIVANDIINNNVDDALHKGTDPMSKTQLGNSHVTPTNPLQFHTEDRPTKPKKATISLLSSSSSCSASSISSINQSTATSSIYYLFKMVEHGFSNSGASVGTHGPSGFGAANLVAPEETIQRRRALLERSHTAMQDVIHEIQTAPIFTENIRAAAAAAGGQLFSQFGLLAGDAHHPSQSEEMYYYNVTAPSSTFICGSQGSGKSHTLSCLLENCLFKTDANELPRPLTAIVFHYDTFTSDEKGSPCEAAYLASNPAASVRVLCAPTNISTMRRTYANMNVTVEPLRIRERDLNTKRMVDLMAVKVGGSMPLYMHVVNRILRDLRIEQQNQPAGAQYFKYTAFKRRLAAQDLTDHQRTPLDQRLDTLESFMASAAQPGNDWTARPGQLTIVDLSCPCVTAESACQLFNICLSLFLEQHKDIGRVVALDEAHKYMNESGESSALTENLLATIRLQRHLAARIIISTQEPTISPKLLDLCSVTIVHRFTSPEWLRTLQKHLAGVTKSDKNASLGAGAANGGNDGDGQGAAGTGNFAPGEDLFAEIVKLRVGEALVFAPSAILKPVGTDTVEKLSHGVLKVRVRQRVTADGGRSIMAG